jgi:mannose-6-phosphate isomerase-like protein (cupin superfamily)
MTNSPEQGELMTAAVPHRYPPVVVRAEEAEHLAAIGHVLLADSSATDGALTTHRVALARGADGAVPHRHDARSELFYIIDGAFDLLVGDGVLVAKTGDLLVVPPGTAHAFAAHRDCTAEALVVATPGVERFDYFRHVVRRRAGSEPAEVLRGLQGRFDTHSLDSAAWLQARGGAVPNGSRHHGR